MCIVNLRFLELFDWNQLKYVSIKKGNTILMQETMELWEIKQLQPRIKRPFGIDIA